MSRSSTNGNPVYRTCTAVTASTSWASHSGEMEEAACLKGCLLGRARVLVVGAAAALLAAVGALWVCRVHVLGVGVPCCGGCTEHGDGKEMAVAAEPLL
mmetsp:Transcript_125866/g.350710  ORF Transcript_125866/g.350710 Transcript_125866/m.350710 type:complete len:99 (-) Transcript_125866:50-346(-)